MPSQPKGSKKPNQAKTDQRGKPKTDRLPRDFAAQASLSLPPWDREISDTASPLNGCAEAAQDRRTALDHALNGSWAAEDISMIRRVESEGRCLWVMWRYPTLPPG
jgi:hypothetical protein